MPKTNGHLKITPAGAAASQIELFGDKTKPEQDTFILKFPGGFVQISRCTSVKAYVVHVGVWEPDMPAVKEGHRKEGEIYDYGVRCHRGVRDCDPESEFPAPIATASMHVFVREK